MSWIEAMKWVAGTAAVELIIFAFIWWQTEPWKPHKVKNTFQNVENEDEQPRLSSR